MQIVRVLKLLNLYHPTLITFRWLGRVDNGLRKLIFPRGRFVQCNDATIFVSYGSQVHRWYSRKNLFLEQEHRVFVQMLRERPPRVVVDIGAHWGILAASLALDLDSEISNSLRLICVEPDPQNIPNLSKTISLVSGFPVTIVPCAIGADKGMTEAYRGNSDCLQTFKSSDRRLESVIVEEISLSTLLDRQGVTPNQLTHLKLDVDGYEPEVLQSSENLLREVQPLVLLEFWAKGLFERGIDLDKYFAFLLSLGKVTKIDYPSGIEIELNQVDLVNLTNETMDSVRNLVVRIGT